MVADGRAETGPWNPEQGGHPIRGIIPDQDRNQLLVPQDSLGFKDGRRYSQRDLPADEGWQCPSIEQNEGPGSAGSFYQEFISWHCSIANRGPCSIKTGRQGQRSNQRSYPDPHRGAQRSCATGWAGTGDPDHQQDDAFEKTIGVVRGVITSLTRAEASARRWLEIVRERMVDSTRVVSSRTACTTASRTISDLPVITHHRRSSKKQARRRPGHGLPCLRLAVLSRDAGSSHPGTMI